MRVRDQMHRDAHMRIDAHTSTHRHWDEDVLILSVQMLNEGDAFELLGCSPHAIIEGTLDKRAESVVFWHS
jgi:hypothetical protein